jgi:hypothetical protein
MDSCTVDVCVESEVPYCEHLLRDMDGDGDGDYHCTGGGDCNDLDPMINSSAPEVCANQRDDNCDGQVDEEPCTTAANDTCSQPALLESGKTVKLTTAGCKLDYAASCVPTGSYSLRDIVGAISVPAGGAMDLDVTARVSMYSVWAGTAGQCADPSTELACVQGTSAPSSGTIARFLARGLTEGAYPVYVWSELSQDVLLTATLRDAQPKPTNETCGTAAQIVPGEQVLAEIFDCTRDLDTACSAGPGDLVYRFETTEPHDIRVFASSVDGLGNPVIGLRDATCTAKSSELGCQTGPAPVVFARAVPAGTWYVDVSATVPTTVQFSVLLSDPTEPPADETCVGSPELLHGITRYVPLQDHIDDIKSTCLSQAPDAAYALALVEPSDVLLVGRLSQNDYGAVSLMKPGCGPSDLLVCNATSPSPVRTSLQGLPAGSYRAVIETQKAGPTQLTAFVRPATPPVFVLFAETCGDAQPIGPKGGLFQGNTVNALPHYGAGCDQAGGSPAGAPDQVLKLELDAARRVVFDMRGSDYRTMLNIRQGPSCPGKELVSACSVGYYEQRSYLDLLLEAGQYWVQVDGFNGEAGQWFLNVFVSEP